MWILTSFGEAVGQGFKCSIKQGVLRLEVSTVSRKPFVICPDYSFAYIVWEFIPMPGYLRFDENGFCFSVC